MPSIGALLLISTSFTLLSHAKKRLAATTNLLIRQKDPPFLSRFNTALPSLAIRL